MFTSIISGKSKKATLKTAVALLAVLFLAIPGMVLNTGEYVELVKKSMF